MKICRIQLSNVLSFSEEKPLDMELTDLNFVVGPNNSGKTNILRALKYFYRVVNHELDSSIKKNPPYIEDDINYQMPKKVDFIDIIRFNNASKPFSIKLTFELDQNKSKSDDIDKIKELLKILGKGLVIEVYRNNFHELYNKIFTLQNSDTKDYDDFKTNFINKYPQTELFKSFEKYMENVFEETWKIESKIIMNQVFPNNKCVFEINYDGKLEHEPELLIHFGNSHNVKNSDFIDNKKNDKRDWGEEYSRFFLKYFENYLKNGTKDRISPLKDAIRRKKNIRLSKVNFSTGENHEEIINYLRNNFIEYNNFNQSLQISSLFNLYHYLLLKIKKFEIITDVNKHIKSKNSIRKFYKLFDSTYHIKLDENIPSILFALKNSPDKNQNRSYYTIKKMFKQITGYDFDVVHNYLLTKKGDKYLPTEIQLYLFDDKLYNIENNNFEQIFYPFNSVGSGLEEILYNIVIMHEKKFVILDEPAQLVHPIMQKKISKLIEEESHKNQFIIITHAPSILPDISNNKNFNTFHFSFNKKDNKTTCQKIDTSVFQQKNYKKIKKSLNRKKDFYFSNLNLLVEGISDEIILPSIIETLDWNANFVTNDIQVIHTWGDQLIPFSKLFMQWALPTSIMIDFDKIDKIKQIPKNVQKIILPSDIEGTLILGEIIWPLMELLKENYMPTDLIKKLNPSSISNPKKCSECNRKIENKTEINKYILKNVKELIEIISNIKNKKDFIENLHELLELSNNQEKIIAIIEKNFDYKFKGIKKIIDKLKSYQLILKNNNGKIEIANELINSDSIMGNLPVQFDEKLKNIIDHVNN